MSYALPLSQILSDLDGQSYRAYRQIKGRHHLDRCILHIDRVQADPYAPPSACRVIVPQAIARFPHSLWCNRSREIALRDYLTRQFAQTIRTSGWQSDMLILQPSQAMLERSCCWINADCLEVRFRLKLPAYGRRIAGKQAVKLLCEAVSQVVEQSLVYAALDGAMIAQHVDIFEDAEMLRNQLAAQNLIAFVADASILARRSGIDDRPDRNSIPFQSPDSLRVTLQTPNQGAISGMGIPSGITLIVGGGFHGKSTLLRAIERGIYNHLPGDGRERVVTDPKAVKIRAEDGRCIYDTDLSMLINHLPLGRSSREFTTENASGSTSQVANLVEAIAAGAQVLLMDEDTCATNLMVRDVRMQRLIATEYEPITPLIDQVRPLYQHYGISIILVMGGCGDYLAVADRVIAMQEFLPQDVTAQAQAIVQALPNQRQPETRARFGPLSERQVSTTLLTPTNPPKPHRGKIQADQKIRFYQQEVDLAAIEQLIEPGQLKTLAAMIVAIHQGWFAPQFTSANGGSSNLVALNTILTVFEHMLQLEQGLDRLASARSGGLVQVRSIELAAALNRLRNQPQRHQSATPIS